MSYIIRRRMLNRIKEQFNIIILILLMTAGCTYVEKSRGTRGIDENLQVTGNICNLYPDLKSQKFAEEISRLESILSKAADPALKAQVHLRLGLLYLDQKNPNPDHLTALKELELYASLDPKGGKKGEIQNLLRALREVEKKKVIIEQIMQENQEVKKKLEQLKTLDLDTEERRQQIK